MPAWGYIAPGPGKSALSIQMNPKLTGPNREAFVHLLKSKVRETEIIGFEGLKGQFRVRLDEFEIFAIGCDKGPRHVHRVIAGQKCSKGFPSFQGLRKMVAF